MIDFDNIEIETSPEEAFSVDEEKPCYFDKIPDEVLENIISFVPNKKNCFLVNKQFNQEAIKATRNRYCLKLNQSSIKDLKFILKTQRAFNEIRLTIHESKKYKSRIQDDVMTIIELFGLQIKTFTLNTDFFDENDVLNMLFFMGRLEKLVIYGKNRASDKDTVDIHINSLKHLEVSNSIMLRRSFCPELEELSLTCRDFIETHNFIRQHSHIKQLVLNIRSDNELKTILAIEGLKLTSLRNLSYMNAEYSEMSSFCLTLSNQDELKILELDHHHAYDNEVVGCITKLSKLETLLIRSYQIVRHDPIIIADILRMDQLKVLRFFGELHVIKPLSTIKNLRLEELSLELSYSSLCFNVDQLEVLKGFAENLPNLKKASFDGFSAISVFYFLNTLKETLTGLESLKILTPNADNNEFQPPEHVNFSAASCNIRELELATNTVNRNHLVSLCMCIMPNVTKLTLIGFPKFDLQKIQRFPELTELHVEANILWLPKSIRFIEKHGKKLKKIVVSEAQHYRIPRFKTVYGYDFPIQKFNGEKKTLEMMRG